MGRDIFVESVTFKVALFLKKLKTAEKTAGAQRESGDSTRNPFSVKHFHKYYEYN